MSLGPFGKSPIKITLNTYENSVGFAWRFIKKEKEIKKNYILSLFNCYRVREIVTLICLTSMKKYNCD